MYVEVENGGEGVVVRQTLCPSWLAAHTIVFVDAHRPMCSWDWIQSSQKWWQAVSHASKTSSSELLPSVRFQSHQAIPESSEYPRWAILSPC